MTNTTFTTLTNQVITIQHENRVDTRFEWDVLLDGRLVNDFTSLESAIKWAEIVKADIDSHYVKPVNEIDVCIAKHQDQ